MLVIGEVGAAKSSLVKTYCYRQAVFGRTCLDRRPQGRVRPARACARRRAHPAARRAAASGSIRSAGRRRRSSGSTLDAGARGHGPRAPARRPRSTPCSEKRCERSDRAGGAADAAGAVELLFSPTAEMADGARTPTSASLTRRARRRCARSQRLCEGELRGMLDGPTSVPIDPASPVDGARPVGVLRLDGARHRHDVRRRVPALRHRGAPRRGRRAGRAGAEVHQRVRRGMAGALRPRRRRMAAGPLQEVAELRRPERARHAPAVRPQRGRRGGQPGGRARRGAPARHPDPRRLSPGAGRAAPHARGARAHVARGAAASVARAGRRALEARRAQLPGAAPPQPARGRASSTPTGACSTAREAGRTRAQSSSSSLLAATRVDPSLPWWSRTWSRRWPPWRSAAAGPGLRSPEMLGVLSRLPQHLDDPETTRGRHGTAPELPGRRRDLRRRTSSCSRGGRISGLDRRPPRWPCGSRAPRGWATRRDLRGLFACGDGEAGRIRSVSRVAAASRGRAPPVGPRRRADPERQDDGARHPRDPRLAGPGGRDEREDGPGPRHDRAPGRSRAGSGLRSDRRHRPGGNGVVDAARSAAEAGRARAGSPAG